LLSHDDIVSAWRRGAVCGSADDVASDGSPLAAVRASLGKDSRKFCASRIEVYGRVCV
jgi:hypothetical protein